METAWLGADARPRPFDDELRRFADNLHIEAFKALSVGIGIGETKERVAKPEKSPEAKAWLGRLAPTSAFPAMTEGQARPVKVTERDKVAQQVLETPDRVHKGGWLFRFKQRNSPAIPSQKIAGKPEAREEYQMGEARAADRAQRAVKAAKRSGRDADAVQAAHAAAATARPAVDHAMLAHYGMRELDQPQPAPRGAADAARKQGAAPKKAKVRPAAPPQPSGPRILTWEKRLVAWSLDFLFVASSLVVCLALALLLAAMRAGNPDDWWTLKPIRWLGLFRPYEVLGGVYGSFFGYYALFRILAGKTLGEGLMARSPKSPYVAKSRAP